MNDEIRKALDTELMVDLYPTAARVLRRERAAIYRDANEGRIPGAVKIGGVWRVQVSKLRELVGLPPIVSMRQEAA